MYVLAITYQQKRTGIYIFVSYIHRYYLVQNYTLKDLLDVETQRVERLVLLGELRVPAEDDQVVPLAPLLQHFVQEAGLAGPDFAVHDDDPALAFGRARTTVAVGRVVGLAPRRQAKRADKDEWEEREREREREGGGGDDEPSCW
jgi:hypothetical protein